MQKLILAPLVLAATATPALADVPYAVTPNGRTEAYFDMGVTAASDKIANGCADAGWQLVSSTSTVVTCQLPVNTMQGILAALTMGNEYSTPPRNYIRFNIAGAGPASRVQATGWIETQMAFGQVRTAEMNGAHYHNNVTALLTGLGGRLPPGTTFPNHAFFGNQFEEAGNTGLRVVDLDPGTPAARGGLQNGDIITRIARERIKTSNDLLDGMRRAARAETFEVEVMRAGKAMKLTLPRGYREPVTGVALSDLPSEPTPATAQVIAPLSSADELAKFAKLKEQGVITQAEFDAQKVRLLGSN